MAGDELETGSDGSAPDPRLEPERETGWNRSFCPLRMKDFQDRSNHNHAPPSCLKRIPAGCLNHRLSGSGKSIYLPRGIFTPVTLKRIRRFRVLETAAMREDTQDNEFGAGRIREKGSGSGLPFSSRMVMG